jgi:hypothetical protein
MLRSQFAFCFFVITAASLVTSGFVCAQDIGARSGKLDEEPRSAKEKSSASKTKKKKNKYVPLLESKDLSSFRGYKTEAIGEGWSVKGKTLYFDGTKGAGDIITKKKYSDFEMQFDWKISAGGNSGVMYRVGLGDEAPYKTGIEFQVLDDSKHADGKKKETSAGAIYALFAPKEYKKKAVGGWNKSRIVVKGSKITHFLNGAKIVEADMSSDEWQSKVSESKFKDWEKFGKEKSGHIAFQDHGNKVWFRNIKIKETDGEAMAAGGDDKKKKSGGGEPAMFDKAGTAKPIE